MAAAPPFTNVYTGLVHVILVAYLRVRASDEVLTQVDSVARRL
jgi:hypothetical protein